MKRGRSTTAACGLQRRIGNMLGGETNDGLILKKKSNFLQDFKRKN
jgi:hypothetical protein